MSYAGWSGDWSAAKEFHANVLRPLDAECRGRGGSRGGRGGSNMTRGGNSFANASFTNNGNGNGRRNGLLTVLPSHLWNPGNTQSTQSTHVPNAEDDGDPMNVDDGSVGGFQWASDTRPPAAHASAGQTGVGSAPTSASSSITNQSGQFSQVALGSTTAPWGSTDNSRTGAPCRDPSSSMLASECRPGHSTNPIPDRAATPHHDLSMSTHATLSNVANGPRTSVAADSQSTTREQVTWGPRNIPVSNIKPFNSLYCNPVTDQRMKDAQNGKTASYGDEKGTSDTASAAKIGRQWPGLRASRHAGAADPVGASGPKQSGAPRRDLLQENGMLKGVQFTEDQGPQQDDDWLKTYNLNKVKDKCVFVAKRAFANGDHEAEKALRNVAAACTEVLRAKNVLRDKRLEAEADKILSKSQKETWVHWIKYYHPTAPATDTASISALNEIPNVQMQDAPKAIQSRTEHVEVPNAITGIQAQAQKSPASFALSAHSQARTALHRPNSGGTQSIGFSPTSFQQQPTRAAQLGNFDYTPSGGCGSSNLQHLHKLAAQQAQVPPQKLSRTTQFNGNNLSGGFGSANTQQTQPAQHLQGQQQSTELTGLPSMFPQGLPAGFDDPQARQIFEDFFFQNQRRQQK